MCFFNLRERYMHRTGGAAHEKGLLVLMRVAPLTTHLDRYAGIGVAGSSLLFSALLPTLASWSPAQIAPSPPSCSCLFLPLLQSGQ